MEIHWIMPQIEWVEIKAIVYLARLWRSRNRVIRWFDYLKSIMYAATTVVGGVIGAMSALSSASKEG